MPSEFLIYLDANNLYGYALSQPLPEGKFRFLDDPENFYVDAVDCDGVKGRTWNIQSTFTTDTVTYPLAVEHLTVTRDMLSEYNAESLFDKQSCLVPNLYNKVKYVTHIKNLKL